VRTRDESDGDSREMRSCAENAMARRRGESRVSFCSGIAGGGFSAPFAMSFEDATCD
jgi:hypothetical protein